MSQFEDTITPETATEAALLIRIGELKRKLWEAGRFASTLDGFPADPNTVPMEVRDFTPTLRLAASAEMALDIPRGLRIEARTHGPTKFGVANYISLHELEHLTPTLEANFMVRLHDNVTRQAGAELKRLLDRA